MLKTVVFDQLKKAMKEKDVVAKGVLSIVKASLDLAQKEKGSELTHEEEMAILNREVKQTHQSLDGAEKANRADLVEKENRKLEILKSFLPEQLSEEKVIESLKEAGISSGMNMGEAMKIAKPLLAGKADGSMIAKAVKSLIK